MVGKVRVPRERVGANDFARTGEKSQGGVVKKKRNPPKRGARLENSSKTPGRRPQRGPVLV